MVKENNITSERYLEGKTGIMIDSIDVTGYFRDYVERLGGKARIFQFIPDNLQDDIENESIDFLIVHNYSIKDKNTLLKIREMGVEMLLIIKKIIPPEQKEEHKLMRKELKEQGVSFGDSILRAQHTRKFLKRIYGQDNSTNSNF